MAQPRPTDPEEQDQTNAADNGPPIFELIVDQASDAICVQDAGGRIEWMNPACEAMFGWQIEEVRGRQALDLIVPPGATRSDAGKAGFRYDFDNALFGSSRTSQHVRRDGTPFWNRQSFSVIDPDGTGTQKKAVITCRDVTEEVNTQTALNQVQTDLEYAAFHDDLTGLANRKKLGDFLRSGRVTRAFALQEIGVLQIDIDKFKEINDTLGHAAGDATLSHAANALQGICGPHDLACRTGGDEFLLVCLDACSDTGLQARADALLAGIGQAFQWKDQTIRIGCSVGVSRATSCNISGEELIQRADQALYSAKNGGRGIVVFYTDRLGRQHNAQQQQARDLKAALAEQQFEIHLQPQLCLQSKTITGFEALIRWNHPDRGLLAPDQFLPTAEKSGLLTQIDYCSMNLALDALCDLRENGFADTCMSINVSGSILRDVNYPGLLDWALQSRGIAPESICIEILETTILGGAELQIATAIERLRRLGVRIALDDFGTGYAGLAHMSTFEIDAIKLDQSMISRLTDDPRNRVIVRSIILLCDLLKIQVVAEGVETLEQLEILRNARCPMIQGFALAHPMPAGDAVSWLRTNTPLADPMTFEPPPIADAIPITSRSQAR